MKSFLFRLRPSILLAAALILSGCGQGIIPADPPSLAKSARLARGKAATPEEQAALYLHLAATAARDMGNGNVPTPARDTYNKAVADLAVLLRSVDDGRSWNRPLTVTAEGRTYRLRFMPGNPQGVWSPDEFTSLVLAQTVPAKSSRAKTARKVSEARWSGCARKTRARRSLLSSA